MGIYFSLRILWKSYMLSWRTKDENFLCLKYLGRIQFSKRSLCLTMKQVPLSVHQIIWLFLLSSNILQVFMMKLEMSCFLWTLLRLGPSDFDCSSLLSSSLMLLDQFSLEFPSDISNQYVSRLLFHTINQSIMTFNFKKKELFSEEKPKIQQPLQEKTEKPEEQIPEFDSFKGFGLEEEIVTCLTKMGYEKPTKIQSETFRQSLKEGDLLCLSETGSGKTLSFVVPILNHIICQYKESPKIPYGLALIIAPTRELCVQINEYFQRFQAAGLREMKSVVLYGGVDPMKQVLQIAKKPTILVATPGRILDHLQNTKGFHLKNLQFLVLDQADKLLNKDFEEQLNQIISLIPQERRAFLFSATLTSRVQKLQRVSLHNPIRIEVNQKYQTVSNLEQFYIFIPSKMKDCYLVHLLNQFTNTKAIVFTQTRLGSQRLTLVLHHLGFSVECLHGDMSQTQRFKSLSNFKDNTVKILITTDVAARGIDISMIELVINYDLCDPKSYIHRVGRTARIGHQGKSISIVTQYDVESLKKIEEKLGYEMKEFPVDSKDAEIFLERLQLCHQQVSRQMKKKNASVFKHLQ